MVFARLGKAPFIPTIIEVSISIALVGIFIALFEPAMIHVVLLQPQQILLRLL